MDNGYTTDTVKLGDTEKLETEPIERTNDYNIGYAVGYDDGFRAGQSMRDTQDAYNAGFNKGMAYAVGSYKE